MKVLIWFLAILTVSVIQTVCSMGGLYLGAIPTALLFGGACAVARALCRNLDRKKKVKDPWKYLKEEAVPQSAIHDGEWACPVCGMVNKNRFSSCIQCSMEKTVAQQWRLQNQKVEKEYKPVAGESRPGDWTCPKCGNVYDKETVRCWKCSMLKKDLEVLTQYQEHVAEKPHTENVFSVATDYLEQPQEDSLKQSPCKIGYQQACLMFRDLGSNLIYPVTLESGVFAVIGREKTAAIPLKSMDAAKIHCLVGFTGGKYYVKHMEAVNGIFLRRGTQTSKVEDYAEILEGDVLILGDVQLKLEAIK